MSILYLSVFSFLFYLLFIFHCTIYPYIYFYFMKYSSFRIISSINHRNGTHFTNNKSQMVNSINLFLPPLYYYIPIFFVFFTLSQCTNDVVDKWRTKKTRRSSTNRVKMFLILSNFKKQFSSTFNNFLLIYSPSNSFHFFAFICFTILNKQQSCHLQDLIKDL